MPPKSDVARIRHMVSAAHEATAFCAGRTRQDLESDLMLSRAVVKSIEIVGEAASQVSTATRNQLTVIPWRDVITMRHRLVHAYFDIRFDIVWSTVYDDLPPLVAALETWLAEQS